MSLETQLATLEQADLIRMAQTQPEIEYLFRHVLVQEAAYNSLLKQNRRALHQASAETFERLYADRLDELSPVLARHFDEAELPERALRYYARAGDLAMAKYANAEALLHYGNALHMARRLDSLDTETLQHLYLRYGRVLEMVGRYADAAAHYTEMEETARARGDRALELAALVARGVIHSAPTAVYDPALAQSLADRAMPLARALDDRPAEAKILNNLLLLHKFLAKYNLALEYGEQAATLARALGMREQLAYILTDVHVIYLFTGRAERGQAAIDEAIALWRALGNLPLLADSLCGMAFIKWSRAEYAQSKAYGDEAYHVSLVSDNIWNQSQALALFSLIHVEYGEIDQMLASFERAVTLARRAGSVASEVIPVGMYSLALATLGLPEQGIETCRRGVALAEQRAMALHPFTLGFYARVCLIAGNLAAAEEALQTARRVMQSDDAFSRISILLAECELATAQSDFEGAVKSADELIGLVAKQHSWLIDGLIAKGRALRLLGETAQARETLTGAYQLATDAGSRRFLLLVLPELIALARERGSTAEAQRHRNELRAVAEFMLTRMSNPALRAAFCALPHIRDALDGGRLSAPTR